MQGFKSFAITAASLILLCVMLIVLTPNKVHGQLDLNTRVNNLENLLFGTSQTAVNAGGVRSCGASVAANAACLNSIQLGTVHILFGTFTLATNTSTITGISPAFSSATSWNCVANDITTRANPVQAIPASTTSLTITDTTGASDLVSVICTGN